MYSFCFVPHGEHSDSFKIHNAVKGMQAQPFFLEFFPEVLHEDFCFLPFEMAMGNVTLTAVEKARQ